MAENPTPTTTTTTTTTTKENPVFTFDVTLPAEAGAVVPAASAAPSADTLGGLTYANASEDERREIERRMAAIDLTDRSGESITRMGKEGRRKASALYDQIFSATAPDAKIAFMDAIDQLVHFIKDNGIEAIRKRIADRSVQHKLGSFFRGVDPVAENKEMIRKFTKDMAESSKLIHDMVDRAVELQQTLGGNFKNLNEFGVSLIEAFDDLQLDFAATQEKLRRLKSGEDPILTAADQQAQSGRLADKLKADDIRANINLLTIVNAGLIDSLGTYDGEIKKVIETIHANRQNQTGLDLLLNKNAEEWKANMIGFALMSSEVMVSQFLANAEKMTQAAQKSGSDMFETMINALPVVINGRATTAAAALEDRQRMIKALEDASKAQAAAFDHVTDVTNQLKDSPRLALLRTDIVTAGKTALTQQPAPPGRPALAAPTAPANPDSAHL